VERRRCLAAVRYHVAVGFPLLVEGRPPLAAVLYY